MLMYLSVIKWRDYIYYLYVVVGAFFLPFITFHSLWLCFFFWCCCFFSPFSILSIRRECDKNKWLEIWPNCHRLLRVQFIALFNELRCSVSSYCFTHRMEWTLSIQNFQFRNGLQLNVTNIDPVILLQRQQASCFNCYLIKFLSMSENECITVYQLHRECRRSHGQIIKHSFAHLFHTYNGQIKTVINMLEMILMRP